ncbi:MAG: hypothetical protein AAF997_07375 [Myxococcota bacterium]
MRIGLHGLCGVLLALAASCYAERSGTEGFADGTPRTGCPDACQNGGVCVGTACLCAPVDFEGVLCETWIDDCESVDCVNGECFDLVRDWACDCFEPYATDESGLCTIEIKDCNTQNACINGDCDDSGGSVICSCDDGYEGPTCNRPVSCGEPPEAPTNAVEFALSGTEFGDTATYVCVPGLQGDAAIVSCGADGSWGEVDITCLNVPGCGAAPLLQYGNVVTPGGTDVGDFAFYSCDPGFNLLSYQGNSIQCQAAEEWEPFYGGCFLVGDCADDPCDNGSCTPWPSTVPVFQCNCGPGWTGPLCDTEI